MFWTRYKGGTWWNKPMDVNIIHPNLRWKIINCKHCSSARTTTWFATRPQDEEQDGSWTCYSCQQKGLE